MFQSVAAVPDILLLGWKYTAVENIPLADSRGIAEDYTLLSSSLKIGSLHCFY